MFFDPDRDRLRQMYLDAWSRFKAGQPLEPVQAQIAAVVLEHPEYHQFLTEPEGALTREFPPELGQSNPFLHMGLHLAVRDQLATDRPQGIRHAYEGILRRSAAEHDAEHVLLECLAESLWRAHRDNRQPDEALYLEMIRKRTPAGAS